MPEEKGPRNVDDRIDAIAQSLKRHLESKKQAVERLRNTHEDLARLNFAEIDRRFAQCAERLDDLAPLPKLH